MKRCKDCGESKPLNQFQKDKQKRLGVRSECKACSKVRKRKLIYGLEHDIYQEMVERQNNTCLLCDAQGDLRVDHNHETGEVRGLLCHKCNTGIGLLGDSPERLRAAARYLEQTGYYGLH